MHTPGSAHWCRTRKLLAGIEPDDTATKRTGEDSRCRLAVSLQGEGHVAMFTAPEVFASEVTSFLTDVG